MSNKTILSFEIESKIYSVDITQGYTSRQFLSFQNYQAIVDTPQFRAARVAHARKLPEAQGKEDFAEYLTSGSIDYSMEQIADKLKVHTKADASAGFLKFMKHKLGQSEATAPKAHSTQQREKPAQDLWAEVIAEVNAGLGANRKIDRKEDRK